MFYDRVNQNSSTSGTGTFVFTTVVLGYQSWAVVGNGNTTYYAAFDTAGNWEVGSGVYNSETLTRVTVLASSNSNTLVSFTSGLQVFQPCPALICNEIGPAGLQYQLQLNSGTGFEGLSNGTTGWILTSNGAGAAPSFQATTPDCLSCGPASPGTAATESDLVGMIYNTSAPTPTNGQQLALQSDAFGNLKVISAGGSSTQSVSGTITSVQSGTYTVSGSVTALPSGTQTVAGSGTFTTVPTGTQTVSGTITNVPSGTQPVSGSVTALPSGTQTVAGSGTFTTAPTGTQGVSGTITSVQSGTYVVSGTVTDVPSGTQTVSGTITNVPSGTTTVQDVADGSVNPGAAGSKSMLGGMVYNTATPAPTNGQQLSLQSDPNGNLKVAGTLTTTPSGTQTVVSGVAKWTTSDTADGPVIPGNAASNSILAGMVYNTAAPAPTNAQQLALQSDASGNLKVDVSNPLATLLSSSPTGTETGVVTRNIPSGTQIVSGSLTTSPSGTQVVSGTITAIQSGTFTTAPTGTQVVSGTQAPSYGTYVSMTLTSLNSLANSATAGWQSLMVSNLTTVADDYEIFIQLGTSSTAPANSQAVYVYVVPWLYTGSAWICGGDGGTATLPSGTQGTYTIGANLNAKGPYALAYTTAGQTVAGSFLLSQFFGSFIPDAWSLIVINYTGATLAASGNTVAYKAINELL